MTFLYLIGGLIFILAGAELFTNGVEWLGKRLKLSEGAVGSVLAAVGTALPETIIPIVAILYGAGEVSEQIGVGAILGAPFMLATLALSITGITALLCRVNGKHRKHMLVDTSILKRDLGYFLGLYSLAVLTAFMPASFRIPMAVVLVLSYIYYAYRTIKDGKEVDCLDLLPLHLCRNKEEPPLYLVIIQLVVSLGGIVLGAHFFVNGIEHIAGVLHISPLVLALFIAPVATELPEKFNSIIWVRKGKDTLAMGNITGAMVFQSSMIPAFGIVYTPWVLSDIALISTLLALAGASAVYCALLLKNRIRPLLLAANGSLYLAFVAVTLIIY
ncbi:MAG: membrane protein [Peptococcaceae bacterium BICA1-7]|nr:MAG: membrane protein [Peptococcaceae bacterium BICA1-7]